VKRRYNSVEVICEVLHYQRIGNAELRTEEGSFVSNRQDQARCIRTTPPIQSLERLNEICLIAQWKISRKDVLSGFSPW